MIVRLARRFFGIKDPTQVEDPVHYNSKMNVDRQHADLKHFRKIMQRAQKPIETFYDFMKEKEVVKHGQNIFDAGCGSGNLVKLIASEFPENTITGADFSETKLNNCRVLYPHINFEFYDIYEEMNAKYDLIICTEVLEHLLYPGKALLNLVKGITEKGKVFITVPNGRTDTFTGHINFWSPESWAVFFEQSLEGHYQAQTGLLFSDKALYAIISEKE